MSKKTRFSLLGMLALRPMSGYMLNKMIQDSIGFFWQEGYGQIYPQLKQLCEDGLIKKLDQNEAEITQRPKTIYTIMPKGREVLEKWLALTPKPKTIRNETLLKVFFGNFSSWSTIREHLNQERFQSQLIIQLLQQKRQTLIDEHGENEALDYWLMTIDYGISHYQMVYDWATRHIEQGVGHNQDNEPNKT